MSRRTLRHGRETWGASGKSEGLLLRISVFNLLYYYIMIAFKGRGHFGREKEKHYVSDNAQLMAKWNWQKNTDVSSYDITVGSNRKE